MWVRPAQAGPPWSSEPRHWREQVSSLSPGPWGGSDRVRAGFGPSVLAGLEAWRDCTPQHPGRGRLCLWWRQWLEAGEGLPSGSTVGGVAGGGGVCRIDAGPAASAPAGKLRNAGPSGPAQTCPIRASGNTFNEPSRALCIPRSLRSMALEEGSWDTDSSNPVSAFLGHPTRMLSLSLACSASDLSSEAPSRCFPPLPLRLCVAVMAPVYFLHPRSPGSNELVPSVSPTPTKARFTL